MEGKLNEANHNIARLQIEDKQKEDAKKKADEDAAEAKKKAEEDIEEAKKQAKKECEDKIMAFMDQEKEFIKGGGNATKPYIWNKPKVAVMKH